MYVNFFNVEILVATSTRKPVRPESDLYSTIYLLINIITGQDGLQEILQNRSKKQEKDLFELPPAPENLENTLYDSEDSEENDYREDLLTQLNVTDIHHMDVTSSEFKSLPKGKKKAPNMLNLFMPPNNG